MGSVLQNQLAFLPFFFLLTAPGCLAEKLEEMRDQERKEDTFTPMPSPYYMELTKLLLN